MMSENNYERSGTVSAWANDIRRRFGCVAATKRAGNMLEIYLRDDEHWAVRLLWTETRAFVSEFCYLSQHRFKKVEAAFEFIESVLSFHMTQKGNN